jgi:hypothetical protein
MIPEEKNQIYPVKVNPETERGLVIGCGWGRRGNENDC